jgi:hypothetical protein
LSGREPSGFIILNRVILAAAWRLALPLAALVCVLGPAPALAHPRVIETLAGPPPQPRHAHKISAHDARATRAYLIADEAYAREAAKELPTSVAAIIARGDAIAGECPAVMTYAPRDSEFEEIGAATRKTLSDAGVAPTRAIRLAFARAIGHLRWSSRVLTKAVRRHRSVEDERIRSRTGERQDLPRTLGRT